MLNHPQDKEILKNYLGRTFFDAWKKRDPISNYNSLELQVNAKCDLSCKYCYYDKNKEFLYPESISNSKKILDNLDILLNWLSENKYYPDFDPFSGELFSQKIGFDVVDKLIDHCAENKKEQNIIIPTNANFCMSESHLEKVYNLRKKAIENNVGFYCSLSVDGLYCDENRPFKNKNKLRDYDKIFTFAKETMSAFHPMIYYDRIEKWFDNFLWFQEMFKKYDLPYDFIYLLEVRNDGWTPENSKKLRKLISDIIVWTFNILKIKKNEFSQLFIRKLFNLSSAFTHCGRGIGCSIQSNIHVRLGDLTVNPCHRLAYDPLQSFHFELSEDKSKIIDISPDNLDMFMSIHSTTFRNFPYCQNCMIKNMCSGGCLGAQFEMMKDPFTPIPSVCLALHAKIMGLIDGLIKVDCLDGVMSLVSNEVQTTVKLILEKGDY